MKNIRPVDKITALWALSEAGLGGIFHAIKMPFTGLIIAGVSVMFLTMIGQLSGKRYRQMVSATLIVLIIKMLISPHTPPTAYFAVLFQGVFGFLIYSAFGLNRFSLVVFSVLALVESGFQKILTLTIFYGNSIWESIDTFYHYLEGEMRFLPDFSGTQILLILYFGMYCLSALLFAWMTWGVIQGLNTDRQELLSEYRDFTFQQAGDDRKKKKKKFWIGRRTRLVVFLLVIIAVLLTFNPEMGWQKAVYVFVRSVVMIVLWYLVAAPLFKYLFERFLRRQKRKFGDEIEFVIGFFPELRSIVQFVRKRTGRIDDFVRLRHFFREVIFLTLHADPSGSKEQKSTGEKQDVLH
jgi:hypothetical protein